MSNNVMTTTTLTKLVSDFQNTFLPANNAELEGFELRGHRKLYEQLAEAYRLGKILLDETSKGAYADLLEKHDIKPVKIKDGKPQSNPWGPAMKLLYGKWQQGTIFAVFKPDRSAEKYASAFRYLDNHGTDPSQVVEFIEDFESDPDDEGNTLRGLFGLVEQDKRENGKKREKPDLEALRAKGMDMTATDVFTFDAPDWMDDEVQYGTLFFEVVDGQMVAYGVDKIEVEQFNKKLEARGKKLSK